MHLQRTLIVLGIAVIVLPRSTAYAQEAITEKRASIIESAPTNTAPTPADQTSWGMVPESRPASLFYKLDVRDPAPPSEEFRFDFAHRPAPATGIRLVPAAGASRGGWAVSGRAGPLRWLTPISSEGGTVMRFGGRVPNQPRTPGLGNFNLSIHYSFE
jgi:hypothetical protein